MRRALAAVLDAGCAAGLAYLGFRLALQAAGCRDEGNCVQLTPLAIAPAALAERIPELGLPALAIGDGAIQWRHALERSGACVPEDGSPLHRVSAIEHCRLADHRQGLHSTIGHGRRDRRSQSVRRPWRIDRNNHWCLYPDDYR